MTLHSNGRQMVYMVIYKIGQHTAYDNIAMVDKWYISLFIGKYGHYNNGWKMVHMATYRI